MAPLAVSMRAEGTLCRLRAKVVRMRSVWFNYVMNLLQWITEHWDKILQNVGIVSGLLVASITFHIDAKVRRAETLFKMNEHHRELWMHFYSHPELAGILDEKRDVVTRPPTSEEVHFVNFLFLHLRSSFYARKAGIYSVQPDRLREDVRALFRFPVPRFVWDELRPGQDEKFASFVEGTIAAPHV